MEIRCEVIQDLIALVRDGVASEESCQLVEEHLKTCESCRSEGTVLSPTPFTEDESFDKKVLNSLKKAAFRIGIALLLVGTVLGVVLTDSMGVFYNFLLMPAVGMLGYWLFREKSLFVPLGVFVLGYLGSVFSMGFVAPFLLISLYTLFCGVGLGIGWLLEYAFGKEKKAK